MKKAGSVLILLVLALAAIAALSWGMAPSEVGGEVDADAFAPLVGEYRAEGEDYGYYALVLKERDGAYWFDLYDVGAGNPGAEGDIVGLNEKRFTVDVEDMGEDLDLPHGWKLDAQRRLTLRYHREGKRLTLTNGLLSISFIRGKE